MTFPEDPVRHVDELLQAPAHLVSAENRDPYHKQMGEFDTAIRDRLAGQEFGSPRILAFGDAGALFQVTGDLAILYDEHGMNEEHVRFESKRGEVEETIRTRSQTIPGYSDESQWIDTTIKARERTLRPLYHPENSDDKKQGQAQRHLGLVLQKRVKTIEHRTQPSQAPN